MNELIRIENGEVKLDSRMIAHHFGKEHKNVLADIRDEMEKLKKAELGGQLIFQPSSYANNQNKVQPCYILTKAGALQLAARYDAVARRKLIMKIEEMEKQPPQITSQFLYQLAKRQEELEKQVTVAHQVIGELKPKADYTDKILKSKGTVTMQQISKDYGMSATAMNRMLHQLGVQYKQSGQWLLYSKHHGKGYTHSETIDITRTDGRPDVTMHTKWTQKGRLFLYNLLKENDTLPMIERDEVEAV